MLIWINNLEMRKKRDVAENPNYKRSLKGFCYQLDENHFCYISDNIILFNNKVVNLPSISKRRYTLFVYTNFIILETAIESLFQRIALYFNNNIQPPTCESFLHTKTIAISFLMWPIKSVTATPNINYGNK